MLFRLCLNSAPPPLQALNTILHPASSLPSSGSGSDSPSPTTAYPTPPPLRHVLPHPALPPKYPHPFFTDHPHPHDWSLTAFLAHTHPITHHPQRILSTYLKSLTALTCTQEPAQRRRAEELLKSYRAKGLGSDRIAAQEWIARRHGEIALWRASVPAPLTDIEREARQRGRQAWKAGRRAERKAWTDAEREEHRLGRWMAAPGYRYSRAAWGNVMWAMGRGGRRRERRWREREAGRVVGEVARRAGLVDGGQARG
ncbi:uncharacterized protein LAJ45_03001 [Morchella importuna]|uniref:uncharacterized protein n=1 Tax=Morchella importuna TaxID=1174673 RepID=UPI001E8DC4DC|nr:uncharacterized protein LAJ45_03001 [Morchella importuna]KAH8152776.1 hypothetical protein LAJ45_03001 [Morchella importuna]